MTTSTAVSYRLGGLASFVRRAAGGMVGPAEREGLADEVSGWRDEYVEGYDSDSDDDSD